MKSKRARIVFNGKYMCKDQCRGVQRYTREVLHALDKMCEPDEFSILVPHRVRHLDNFNNIRVIKTGGFLTTKLWQLLGMQLYLLIHRCEAVCLSDGVPLTNIRAMAIHDVRYLSDLKMTHGLKKVRLCFVKWSMSNAIRHSKFIITVSSFSKSEILKAFPDTFAERILVCPNAWQHLESIGFDDAVFERYPDITKGEYYFILGGGEKSKNMLWVEKMVSKYPERLFVMAGPKNLYFPDDSIDIESNPNFKHLGYITDEEMKSLMRNSKLFLFPSKYEGFGIPPLEALSVNANVAVSDIPVLKEVYKDSVAYFNPDDFDTDLDELLYESKRCKPDVLELYSWDKTAALIKHSIV